MKGHFKHGHGKFDHHGSFKHGFKHGHHGHSRFGPRRGPLLPDTGKYQALADFFDDGDKVVLIDFRHSERDGSCERPGDSGDCVEAQEKRRPREHSPGRRCRKGSKSRSHCRIRDRSGSDEEGFCSQREENQAPCGKKGPGRNKHVGRKPGSKDRGRKTGSSDEEGCCRREEGGSPCRQRKGAWHKKHGHFGRHGHGPHHHGFEPHHGHGPHHHGFGPHQGYGPHHGHGPHHHGFGPHQGFGPHYGHGPHHHGFGPHPGFEPHRGCGPQNGHGPRDRRPYDCPNDYRRCCPRDRAQNSDESGNEADRSQNKRKCNKDKGENRTVVVERIVVEKAPRCYSV